MNKLEKVYFGVLILIFLMALNVKAQYVDDNYIYVMSNNELYEVDKTFNNATLGDYSSVNIGLDGHRGVTDLTNVYAYSSLIRFNKTTQEWGNQGTGYNVCDDGRASIIDNKLICRSNTVVSSIDIIDEDFNAVGGNASILWKHDYPGCTYDGTRVNDNMAYNGEYLVMGCLRSTTEGLLILDINGNLISYKNLTYDGGFADTSTIDVFDVEIDGNYIYTLGYNAEDYFLSVVDIVNPEYTIENFNLTGIGYRTADNTIEQFTLFQNNNYLYVVGKEGSQDEIYITVFTKTLDLILNNTIGTNVNIINPADFDNEYMYIPTKLNDNTGVIYKVDFLTLANGDVLTHTTDADWITVRGYKGVNTGTALFKTLTLNNFVNDDRVSTNGVLCELTDSAGLISYGSKTTNSSGVIEFSGLEVGNYKTVCTLDNGAYPSILGDRIKTVSHSLFGFDIEYDQKWYTQGFLTSTIDVYVRDYDTKQPLSNIEINYYNTQSPNNITTRYTNNDGYLSVTLDKCSAIFNAYDVENVYENMTASIDTFNENEIIFELNKKGSFECGIYGYIETDGVLTNDTYSLTCSNSTHSNFYTKTFFLNEGFYNISVVENAQCKLIDDLGKTLTSTNPPALFDLNPLVEQQYDNCNYCNCDWNYTNGEFLNQYLQVIGKDLITDAKVEVTQVSNSRPMATLYSANSNDFDSEYKVLLENDVNYSWAISKIGFDPQTIYWVANKSTSNLQTVYLVKNETSGKCFLDLTLKSDSLYDKDQSDSRRDIQIVIDKRSSGTNFLTTKVSREDQDYLNGVKIYDIALDCDTTYDVKIDSKYYQSETRTLNMVGSTSWELYITPKAKKTLVDNLVYYKEKIVTIVYWAFWFSIALLLLFALAVGSKMWRGISG